MSERSPRVVVVGSVNYDITIPTTRIPAPGETVSGEDSSFSPGGKGANQAAQAGLLNAHVTFVARVGADAFGDLALASLGAAGVDTTSVARDAQAPTGLAVVLLEPTGENRILIAPNANARLSPADVDAAAGAIGASGAVVAQLEIPPGVVARAAEVAAAHGVPFILNAAPPRDPPRSVLAATTWLIVNESEAQALSGIDAGEDAGLACAARALQAQGPRGVVVTRGAHGVFVVNNGDGVLVPAAAVERVVDTTGAGDAFVGAFAVALAEGASPAEAAGFGAAAGAAAVSRPGAQSALASREAIERALRD